MNNDVIKNKYDFMIIFDVKNGNPNGDPRMDNRPRYNYESGYGYITDVCIKRKIRNFIEAYAKDTINDGRSYDMFITDKDNRTLNNKINEYKYEYTKDWDVDRVKKDERDIKTKATEYMCNRYYDVRAFGAVMSTGAEDKTPASVDDNGKKISGENKKKSDKEKALAKIIGCYNITGPIQINFADSVNPVTIEEVSITRKAITSDKDKEKLDNGYGTMGNKYIIPYSLYTVKGHINPCMAEKSGFTEKDLELFWIGVQNMFELDRSATKGEMIVQKIIIFKHSNKYGNVPSNKLFNVIEINKNVSIPNSFKDYVISINKSNIPDNVTLIEL